MKYILKFTEIRTVDLPRVGGKGANLGEMTHANLPVPPGLCLTTDAFDLFMQSDSSTSTIYDQLESVNVDDLDQVRTIGKNIRDTINKISIPTEIIEELKSALSIFEDQSSYAIRSSATAEDLPDASFAGQQDTYLNIRGEDAILNAIRKCWGSLFTDRAILYRIKNGFDHGDVKLSVVIQKMIQSEIAGTMFTVDPLTGHRHTLTIDASYGLGEALVSGIVSPDQIKIDKRNNSIIQKHIGEKKVEIVFHEDNGTETIDVDSRRSEILCLSDQQILQLTELGARIEQYYGSAQDIEWAIEKDTLYMLQTRPITSLYPIDGLKSNDGTLRVYLNMGNQQSMTSTMTPFGMSTLIVLLPLGHSEGRFSSTVIKPSGNRIFADITPILRHRIAGKRVKMGLSLMDALTPQAIDQVSKRPEFKQSKPAKMSFSTMRFVSGLLRKVLKSLFIQDLSGFVEKINNLMNGFVDEIKIRISSKNTGKGQIEELIDIMNITFPYMFKQWIPQFMAGIAATKILERKSAKYLSAIEVEKLTLGLEGNAVQDMNFMIADLADIARDNPELVKTFEIRSQDGNEWLEQIRGVDSAAGFCAKWDDFIYEYGARGPAEIELSHKRWYEDPLPVLKVIAEFLQREKGRHRVLFANMINEREEVKEILLQKVRKGLFGKTKYKIYNRLYYTMSQVGGMREHHKFFVIKVLAEIKKTVVKNAEMLVELGKINNPEDVFFLKWEELISIWDDDETAWQEVIENRRMTKERNNNFSVQGSIITSDGEIPMVEYRIEDAPENALLGNPVSSGVIEGIVHIIKDPVNESLEPGEILVTEFTDPGWTPLFINAKALVLEVGGALTHGAVVAREYGIPAVVGVRNATLKLKTGMNIRVDGNRGIIEILDE
ncbi:MAG: phosphoenolpyruvate synthase [Candidatus Heimdallarchaeota archaeon]|nr:phosphoenolpyruvate synthase [Candidatus Heimdallarchaeota archaeon]